MLRVVAVVVVVPPRTMPRAVATPATTNTPATTPITTLANKDIGADLQRKPSQKIDDRDELLLRWNLCYAGKIDAHVVGCLSGKQLLLGYFSHC